MEEEENNFVGRHLILDVQLKSLKNLNQINEIYHILENLSVLLNMTLVYPPIVAKFPWATNELKRFTGSLKQENINSPTLQKMNDLIYSRQKEEAGVSGICVWLESHAAIHTWTESLFFSFDAYSCKEFDSLQVVEFFLSHFDIKQYNGLNIKRTMDEPQKIEIVKGKF